MNTILAKNSNLIITIKIIQDECPKFIIVSLHLSYRTSRSTRLISKLTMGFNAFHFYSKPF